MCVGSVSSTAIPTVNHKALQVRKLGVDIELLLIENNFSIFTELSFIILNISLLMESVTQRVWYNRPALSLSCIASSQQFYGQHSSHLWYDDGNKPVTLISQGKIEKWQETNQPNNLNVSVIFYNYANSSETSKPLLFNKASEATCTLL